MSLGVTQQGIASQSLTPPSPAGLFSAYWRKQVPLLAARKNSKIQVAPAPSNMWTNLALLQGSSGYPPLPPFKGRKKGGGGPEQVGWQTGGVPPGISPPQDCQLLEARAQKRCPSI